MSQITSSARELGAVDFIAKPINFNDLIVHVKKCLEKR